MKNPLVSFETLVSRLSRETADALFKLDILGLVSLSHIFACHPQVPLLVFAIVMEGHAHPHHVCMEVPARKDGGVSSVTAPTLPLLVPHVAKVRLCLCPR